MPPVYKGPNRTLTSRFRNRCEMPKTFSGSFTCALGCCVQPPRRTESPTAVRICTFRSSHPHRCLLAKSSRGCPFQRIWRPIFKSKLTDSGRDAHRVKNSLDASEAIRGHAGMSLCRVSAPSYRGIVKNTNLVLAVPLKKMWARVSDLQI